MGPEKEKLKRKNLVSKPPDTLSQRSFTRTMMEGQGGIVGKTKTNLAKTLPKHGGGWCRDGTKKSSFLLENGGGEILFQKQVKGKTI